ncbi:MAG TPA: hypothetical protein VHD60_03620 [Candidatus Saccharimonadales bacterium]|nr:hypothetical protein [Candidatus Saccharimonadales bacterium]
MEHLTEDGVKALLAEKPTAPAVTIYVPTHRSATPPHMTEDQIRFKNLIHKAVDIIKNREDGKDVQKQLCDQLEALLDDKNFLEGQTEGMLVCARPGKSTIFHLPIDTEEYVAVDTHYHLAPVFGLLHDAHEYYVLVVAQHEPAFYKGDMYGLHPTKLTLPKTVEEGLQIDEMNQKSEQQRSAGGDTGGFNGRGGAKNPAEEERQRFWRMIDQLILNKTDAKLPLILAGVESELSEYREQSHYPHVLQDIITGSFRGANLHELFALAQPVIRTEIVQKDHDQIVEQFERLKGENETRVGRTVAAISDGAQEGRVDTLLLAMLRITTDTIKDDTRAVPVITFPEVEESSQALHDIASTVWAAGGHIINIEQDAMPDGLVAAAIFRY